MRLAGCVAVAAGQKQIEAAAATPAATGGQAHTAERAQKPGPAGAGPGRSDKGLATGAFNASGQGLPSQTDFTVTGRALVTGVPITLLGFVNRQTGVIEEAGHPADGRSMAGKIVIFPKGSGSTVAPYVLLELFYRGVAPIAVVNTEIDQQSAPACSLEGIPYAYGFDRDVIGGINEGDLVTLARAGDRVTIRVVERAAVQEHD
jgi:predicted aconitase with swiveling domain